MTTISPDINQLPNNTISHRNADGQVPTEPEQPATLAADALLEELFTFSEEADASLNADTTSEADAEPVIESDEEMEEDIQQAQTVPMETLLKEVSGTVSAGTDAPAVDSVRLYLREIGLHPLLTGEEEVALAQMIVESRAAQATLDENDSAITQSERSALADMVARGEKARRRLAQSNLRLVVSIAKRYNGRGLTFLDLIQEGSMGLLRAVEKFDHTLGYKFSTYATWWIRQSLSRAISDQARTIRIPVHMVETINRQTRVERQLEQELGRDPLDEELALGMDYLEGDDAHSVRQSLDEDADLPADVALRLARAVKKVVQVKKLKREPLSLQQPVGSEANNQIADLIEDSDAPDPVELASQQILKEQIGQLLDELDDRERTVLIKRFGLEDGFTRTLEDVGKELQVTRERVRQIEAKALRKLRHPMRSRSLAEFM